MRRIRKDKAGSDSKGNTWDKDGAVVEVEEDHARDLLAIPHGGFTDVTDDKSAKAAPAKSEPAPAKAEPAAKKPATGSGTSGK